MAKKNGAFVKKKKGVAVNDLYDKKKNSTVKPSQRYYVSSNLSVEFDKYEDEADEDKLILLKKFTDDELILSNVKNVAFNQDDLTELLDKEIDTIYLCGNSFVIPTKIRGKKYIGVNEPIVKCKLLDGKTLNDYDIEVLNVHLEAK